MDNVKPGLGLLEKLAQGKKDNSAKESDSRRELGLPVPF